MGLLRLNGALGPKIMTAQDFDAIPVLCPQGEKV